jgi:serine/threonine protein kinase
MTATIPQTLSQRLSEGRIPVSEALRYAMILADSLRKIHDDGRAHGAVSPSTISLTATGLELLPPPALDSETAYMAPEVLAGRPADSRSDIFSFGAVVYEMLSGKRAFEGAERGAMAPSGSPALDRLVGGCVAKDPAARIQRVQKVMLELKLLAVSAARSAAPAIPRRDPGADAQLRAETQQVEERLTARVQTSEHALAETQIVTAGLSARVQQLEAQLAAALKRIEELEQRPLPVPTDISHLEHSMEGVRVQVSELHDLVAEDFMNFEKALQSQATAIDSARTAMAQTDDLVERVVEALESLQATVLENSEDHAMAIN